MPSRRTFLRASTAAIAIPAMGGAFAQAFPSRSIKLVVPYTAGGTGDTQARIIGEHMARSLGQPVVVENKPGGSTIIAAAHVAKSPADGYTLLLLANSVVINSKLRAGSLPYRGLQAFEPVACLTNSPQVIAVNSASPWHTLKDWLDAAKAKPETLSYASIGPASTQHIALEVLLRQAGVKGIYVPYPGGTAAVNAVLAGHASLTLQNLSETQSFLEAGKLRALAVTTPKRMASHPDIPTVAETGLTGYEAHAWFGLAAAAGTPANVVEKLGQAALAAVRDAEIRKKLVGIGLDPYAMNPKEFSAHINSQYQKYSKMIDDSGIKAEK